MCFRVKFIIKQVICRLRCSNIGQNNSYIIIPNCFCYYVQKGHGFRENLVSVIVSTFLLFMFVDQLSLVDVFSQPYYLTDAKKQNNNVGLTVINR